MPLTQPYQYLIVGAGLAGLALAEALITEGVTGHDIGILDAAPGPGAGASGGPGLLLNPLPGRSLVPKPGYLDAFAQAIPWLQRLQDRAGETICLQQAPLLRPLLPGHKGSQRLLQSFAWAKQETAQLLELEQLNAAALARLCPWLSAGEHPLDGAIMLSPACMLWPQPALQAQIQWLAQEGVEFHWQHRVMSQSYARGRWSVDTAQGNQCLGDNLILAMGAEGEGAGMAIFGDLAPWEQVGGALLVVEPPEGPPLRHMLSGAGVHIAPRPDGMWIVGATYEPPNTTPLTDQQSIDTLIHKATAFLPALRQGVVQSVWRGRRLVLPRTRMPFCGPDPITPRRWFLGAFASKGLLLIPAYAKALAFCLVSAQA